jgi:hypothetical protein
VQFLSLSLSHLFTLSLCNFINSLDQTSIVIGAIDSLRRRKQQRGRYQQRDLYSLQSNQLFEEQKKAGDQWMKKQFKTPNGCVLFLKRT